MLRKFMYIYLFIAISSYRYACGQDPFIQYQQHQKTAELFQNFVAATGKKRDEALMHYVDFRLDHAWAVLSRTIPGLETVNNFYSEKSNNSIHVGVRFFQPKELENSPSTKGQTFYCHNDKKIAIRLSPNTTVNAQNLARLQFTIEHEIIHVIQALCGLFLEHQYHVAEHPQDQEELSIFVPLKSMHELLNKSTTTLVNRKKILEFEADTLALILHPCKGFLYEYFNMYGTSEKRDQDHMSSHDMKTMLCKILFSHKHYSQKEYLIFIRNQVSSLVHLGTHDTQDRENRVTITLTLKHTNCSAEQHNDESDLEEGELIMNQG